jgi:hypothetical protein
VKDSEKKPGIEKINWPGQEICIAGLVAYGTSLQQRLRRTRAHRIETQKPYQHIFRNVDTPAAKDAIYFISTDLIMVLIFPFSGYVCFPKISVSADYSDFF